MKLDTVVFKVVKVLGGKYVSIFAVRDWSQVYKDVAGHCLIVENAIAFAEKKEAARWVRGWSGLYEHKIVLADACSVLPCLRMLTDVVYGSIDRGREKHLRRMEESGVTPFGFLTEPDSLQSLPQPVYPWDTFTPLKGTVVCEKLRVRRGE